MKITRMRLVLPARMAHSAQHDARIIAEAAAKALQNSPGSRHQITVRVPGQGRPATFISQSVYQETRRQVQAGTGEG